MSKVACGTRKMTLYKGNKTGLGVCFPLNHDHWKVYLEKIGAQILRFSPWILSQASPNHFNLHSTIWKQTFQTASEWICSTSIQSKKTAQPSINAYPLHFLSDDLGICSRNSVVTDIRSSSISVCKHLAGTFLSSESQGFSAVSGKFVFFFQAEIQENSETEKKHGLLWFLQNQPWPETKGRTTQGSWSSSSWHLPIKDLLDEDHVPGAKSPTLVQPAANRKDDQAKTLRQEDWQPW